MESAYQAQEFAPVLGRSGARRRLRRKQESWEGKLTGCRNVKKRLELISSSVILQKSEVRRRRIAYADALVIVLVSSL